MSQGNAPAPAFRAARNHLMIHRCDSMGLTMPDHLVSLLNRNSRETDEGEVYLKLDDLPGNAPDDHPSTGRPLRAYGSPQRQLRAGTANMMHDGHHRLGNVVQHDTDDHNIFVNRANDVFKAPGNHLCPFNLEIMLMEHEFVSEMAVVPNPIPVCIGTSPRPSSSRSRAC